MAAFLKNTIYFVFTMIIAVILLPVTGFTQTNDQLQNRVSQLEKQIQTMSRAVYRGESIEPAYDTTTNNIESITANIEIRISNIEKQLRLTTGQLEQYDYQNRELKKRLERLENTASTQIHIEKPQVTTSTTLYATPQSQQTKPTILTNPSQSLGILTNAITVDSPEKAYEQAYTHIRGGEYKDAAEAFKKFLEDYPKNKLSSNAQYWLAETYYVRGKYSNAAKMFAKGYAEYPKSPKTADNLLKLGLSLSKSGNKKDACLTFSQLEKEFPNKTGMIIQRALQEKKRLECSPI